MAYRTAPFKVSCGRHYQAVTGSQSKQSKHEPEISCSGSCRTLDLEAIARFLRMQRGLIPQHTRARLRSHPQLRGGS